MDTYQVNRTFYLLATVGSWRDTQTDEQTLSGLREWNEKGKDALRGTSFISDE